MPLPLILWGAAAALAATGVIKGAQAKSNFDEAKIIGERAERNYQKAQVLMDQKRTETQEALGALGRLKLEVMTQDIQYLVNALKKARSQLAGFQVHISLDQMGEFERLVLNSLELERGLGSGAVGGALAAMGAYGAVGTLATASTGAAISGLTGVAATNATLAWLGGGSLAAGGFGMAGGMLALGGIVLGPALAIGGFMMASKAEEALTKAREYDASVDVAISKLELAEVSLRGIRSNAAEVANVIRELSVRFKAVQVPDDQDMTKFVQMVLIGKKLKEVLDISIIQSDGSATTGIKQKCEGLLEIKSAGFSG